MSATTLIPNLEDKIYSDVLVMVESGVFDFKAGKAIIHRDADGNIRKIDMELVRYSKGRN